MHFCTQIPHIWLYSNAQVPHMHIYTHRLMYTYAHKLLFLIVTPKFHRYLCTYIYTCTHTGTDPAHTRVTSLTLVQLLLFCTSSTDTMISSLLRLLYLSEVEGKS